jgi:hypothetical protein
MGNEEKYKIRTQKIEGGFEAWVESDIRIRVVSNTEFNAWKDCVKLLADMKLI